MVNYKNSDQQPEQLHLFRPNVTAQAENDGCTNDQALQFNLEQCRPINNVLGLTVYITPVLIREK